jgi:hypothetical protein
MERRRRKMNYDFSNVKPMYPKGGKDFSLRVRIAEEDKERFYRICDERGMTPSKVLRMLVSNWCDTVEGRKV